MDDQEIRNSIVNTMLHKGIVGGHKARLRSVVGWAVASHDEGRAKRLVDDLVQEGIVEQYGGGARENIRLSSVDVAVSYLKDHDGDVPFSFE